MTKKLLAMLLAVVMIVSCLPMSVLAADVEEIEDPSTEVYSEAPAEAAAAPEAEDIEDAAAAETTADLATSGTCGENATWTLDAKGTLTISGTGVMESDAVLHSSSEYVKKAVIGKGITAIGLDAFEGFSNMTSVSIPSTVTDIETCAFYQCSALKSVTIPSGVTQIWDDAFYGCTSLTSVTIPKSVTYIGMEAFQGCSSLKTLKFASGCAAEIGDFAFCACTALKSVTIPKTIASIGLYAFGNDTSLKTVTIQGKDTYIYGMAFMNTPWAASKEDEYGSLIVNGMLCQCNNLEIASAVVPFGVTTITSDAFLSCNQMTDVVITSDVSRIDEYAFQGCVSLQTVLYTGSEEDWAAIDGTENIPCENIEFNYVYSEWVQSGKKWYWYENNVPVTSDWRQIDTVYSATYEDTGEKYTYTLPEWYYFDAKGVMATGWKTITDANGTFKYYFYSDGTMATDWVQLSKKWYFLCTADGDIPEGAMVTGLWDIVYPVYDENGEVTDTTTSTYYFNPKTGVMLTGWQTIKDADGVSHKYYFDKEFGAMVKNTTYYVGSKLYAFDENGVMQTETWITNTYTDDWDSDFTWTETYYFTKTGAAATGWQTIKDAEGNSHKYYFDKYGVMYQAQTYYDENAEAYVEVPVFTIGKKNYYFDENGVMQTGFQIVQTTFYDEESGNSGVRGLMCYFDPKTGAMVTGWKTIEGRTYYFDPYDGGNKAYGMYPIGKKTYYFATDFDECNDESVKAGQLMKNCWVNIGECVYRFDKNGVMVTKNTKIGDKLYYFNADGTCTNYDG